MVNRRGVTLVEMMIAVAILGAVVLIAPAIFLQIQRINLLFTAKSGVQQDVRAGIDMMTRRLREAQAATVVIDSLSGQPPYSRISFTSVNGTDYSFYQRNKELYISENGGAKKLSDNLRYLSFTFPRSDDPTIVSVSITMEKSTYESQTKALQLSIEKVRIMN